jgi:hypothetical protein
MKNLIDLVLFPLPVCSTLAAHHPDIAAKMEKLLAEVHVESAEFPLAAKNKDKKNNRKP